MTPTTKSPGQIAYEAYEAKAETFDPMPNANAWDDMTPYGQGLWEAAAQAVIEDYKARCADEPLQITPQHTKALGEHLDKLRNLHTDAIATDQCKATTRPTTRDSQTVLSAKATLAETTAGTGLLAELDRLRSVEEALKAVPSEAVITEPYRNEIIRLRDREKRLVELMRSCADQITHGCPICSVLSGHTPDCALALALKEDKL